MNNTIRLIKNEIEIKIQCRQKKCKEKKDLWSNLHKFTFVLAAVAGVQCQVDQLFCTTVKFFTISGPH